MLRKAAEGTDPREPEEAADTRLTYAELVDAYVERHLKPNTRSWKDIRSSLLHPVLRHFRTRPAAGITKREIVEAIDGIVAKGAPQAAVNILRRLKMLFNWACDRDMIAASPCDRIRPPAKIVERDRVLDDAEIVAVWNRRLPASA